MRQFLRRDHPMFTASQLDIFLRYRLDAVGLAVLALAACYGCRRRVRRRHADLEFSRATCWFGLVLIVCLRIAFDLVVTPPELFSFGALGPK